MKAFSPRLDAEHVQVFIGQAPYQRYSSTYPTVRLTASKAPAKSSSLTRASSPPRRNARTAASLASPASWAPDMPRARRATALMFASMGASMRAQCKLKMRSRARAPGNRTCMRRSNRPGRVSARSRTSYLFVAAITSTRSPGRAGLPPGAPGRSAPSMHASNCVRTISYSRWEAPESAEPPRSAPIESISSMKITAGVCARGSRARAKSSRTLRAPSPTQGAWNSGAATA
mmetsp:Transcript_34229/g.85243  ORF Transcript_34229/g.85243 Transcript_34229/m.85243 type:complete len:231 (-) Transcript_34229:726-1418(-)